MKNHTIHNCLFAFLLLPFCLAAFSSCGLVENTGDLIDDQVLLKKKIVGDWSVLQESFQAYEEAERSYAHTYEEGEYVLSFKEDNTVTATYEGRRQKGTYVIRPNGYVDGYELEYRIENKYPVTITSLYIQEGYIREYVIYGNSSGGEIGSGEILLKKIKPDTIHF